MSKWTKKGFAEFSKGTMGNGGQNLYVSAKGTLQRIFNFDVNGDGYPDLPITNSHSMNEKPNIYIYDEVGQEKPLELPSNGSFDAIFVDLYDRGVEDLVVACQHNGVHSDVSSIIYFGSEIGLSEKYKMELRAPNAVGVAAGDFKNCGKKALAFVCGKKLRVFYQDTHGIEASKFEELDIAAVSIASADIDGDGYDDIYVILQGTGEVAVFWGGEDGINPERKTIFGKPAALDDSRATSTTAGRNLFRWVPWRCNVVTTKDKVLTFRAEDNYAVFESFGADRQPVEEIRIKCMEKPLEKKRMCDYMFFGGGAMHATSGDLRGDGSSDIIISVATDFDKIDNTIVLWEKENYSFEKACLVPIRAAKALSVGKWGNDGKNYLFVSQTTNMHELTIETGIFSFDKDGNATEVRRVPSHEPVRMLSGKSFTDGRYQMAVINHEGENKLGFEEVWIYLGGEDGYNADRKLAFPSCAAVDTFMVDLIDKGTPDVIIMNCAENAPMLSPGPVVYWNSPDGFDTVNNKTHFIEGENPHGGTIGDFRKSGYLDIITGSLGTPDIKIFEGGPDGYDFEHPKLLALGPKHKEYMEKFAGVPYEYFITHHEKGAFYDPEVKQNYNTTRWLFAADFNGDGWLDLFVSEIVGDRSFIFWGGPDGFSNDRMQEIATDGISAANAADLNGNGYLDLICSCHLSKKHTFAQEYGKFVIYWGGPDGYQEHRKTELKTACSNALTIHDFNGDGRLDIYGTAYANGRCRDIDSKLYFQTEDGFFHETVFQDIFNHSGCGCLAGDFNGDGFIDLAVASHKAYGNHVCDAYVFWGGEDGINEQRYTKLPCRGPHGMCSVDIGNITDRSNSEYYYSEAYKTEESATKVSWVAENGKKTWVKIQLRCADSIEALETAEWSESFENGADISALNLTGYVQYKLELGAYCGCGTPRVTEVTVDFE